MSLKALSVESLEKMSDAAIFERAERYYLQRRIEDLEYLQAQETITATVVGQESIYDVTLRWRHEQLSGFCTCPYDGYPCKHLVAVGLEFANNQSQYLQALASRALKFKQLETRLLELPTTKLIGKLMDRAAFDDALLEQLELIVSWGAGALVTAYENKLKKHFKNKAPTPDFLLETLKVLRRLYLEILLFEPTVQLKLTWEIMNSILSYFNSHGLDEEVLDDLFYQIWEDTLLPLLEKDPLESERVINAMKAFENNANCSLAANLNDCYSDLEDDE